MVPFIFFLSLNYRRQKVISPITSSDSVLQIESSQRLVTRVNCWKCDVVFVTDRLGFCLVQQIGDGPLYLHCFDNSFQTHLHYSASGRCLQTIFSD